MKFGSATGFGLDSLSVSDVTHTVCILIFNYVVGVSSNGILLIANFMIQDRIGKITRGAWVYRRSTGSPF